MPELPDVEGFRRVIDRHARGRRITRVEAADASVLRNTTAAALERALRGRRFRPPERHGKWLLARTDGPTVLLHFGISGELVWAEGDEGRHAHDRVIVITEGGELRYRDQRKLQGIRLAADGDGIEEITGRQGPDALGLSRRDFEGALADRRGGLKATLMDQSVVAGLGNLLTDEILWRAGLHPGRRAAGLDHDEVGRLHRAMRSVLRTSVSAGRVPPRPSWLTGVRDHDAPACPRCGAALRRSRAGGRRSWWCPRCQPQPG